MISVASRLPKVMVPVLSSSSVSTSPAASTARPDIASTLKRTSRSMPAMPMAESKRADGGRDQRHEQRHQDDDGNRAAGIGRIARDRRGREHEDDGQADQQDVERDLVRRFLPLGALDQRDHAVEEGRTRRRGDAHDDPVGNHGRAAGHRRAVAAGFADDGRGFAGDRRLVDRGDAFDHIAIAGDHVAGLDDDKIAGPQIERRDRLKAVPLFRHPKAFWLASRRGCGAMFRLAPCRGLPPRLRRNWRTAR